MPTSAKGVRFITAGSHRGRQMRQAKGSRVIDKPLSEHNKAIEDKRAAELADRKYKKAQKC